MELKKSISKILYHGMEKAFSSGDHDPQLSRTRTCYWPNHTKKKVFLFIVQSLHCTELGLCPRSDCTKLHFLDMPVALHSTLISHSLGRVSKGGLYSPKWMNFRRNSERGVGGRGVISDLKNFIATLVMMQMAFLS